MNSKEEALDMKFAALIASWRVNLKGCHLAAEGNLTMLEDLWSDVLETQGRTEADLSGRVLTALNPTYPNER